MNTIVCPSCGEEVEVTQALRHQIEDQVLGDVDKKHKAELVELRTQIEAKATKKARDDQELLLKDIQTQAGEEKDKNKKLTEQLTELMKQMRDLKTKDEERGLEMEKTLRDERVKLQEEISKSISEKADFEKKDLQKQLDDTKKLLEDAQRKADQKSQQLQGEVLELELEHLLRSSFPHDEIVGISKGIAGADIRHVVKSPRGTTCGVILWELKRTKDWSDKWIPKLKEDLRAEGADIPVIVSIDLPKEAAGGFGQKDGVIICSQTLVLSIATLLRKNLLDVGYQKAVSANKGDKAEFLHSYITGREFQQHIENIAEAYRELSLQIIKERTAFQKIWKIREAQAQRIILSAASIYGSMQGIVGGSMPQVKGLELEELGDGEEEQLDLLTD